MQFVNQITEMEMSGSEKYESGKNLTIQMVQRLIEENEKMRG
jgi:hypothetical protein